MLTEVAGAEPLLVTDIRYWSRSPGTALAPGAKVPPWVRLRTLSDSERRAAMALVVTWSEPLAPSPVAAMAASPRAPSAADSGTVTARKKRKEAPGRSAPVMAQPLFSPLCRTPSPATPPPEPSSA